MAADLVLRAVDDTRINRAALTLLRLHYVEFLTGWIDTDKELPDEDVTAARAWLDEMSAHCGYVEVSPVSFGKARGINDPQWIPDPLRGSCACSGTSTRHVPSRADSPRMPWRR